ncbi:MAG: hypothetical protein DRI57_04360 [Deltaproteobacteria bacterium]|nr:MAG: hypothetical protein DRI57_04360 [Deltaproteobacteria bacterium]
MQIKNQFILNRVPALNLIHFLLLILLATMSCRTLPRLEPASPLPTPEIRRRCSIPFPDGRWQFVHSIETTMSGGKKGFVIGITDISPETETIRCVIMTIEGLVLFDAQYDQKIVIHRGISPFDSINFAKGLMNDIRLIFFRPDGQFIESGISDNGAYVCRYKNNDSRIIDVITNHDNTWEIRKYNKDFSLMRSVKAYPPGQESSLSQKMIPGKLELTAHGSQRYALILELIKADTD